MVRGGGRVLKDRDGEV